MEIGERIRAIREQKKLAQGDIEKRSGLLRTYISRVENGHTIPSVETLEKIARALDVPLYQLLYDGVESHRGAESLARHSGEDFNWAGSRKQKNLVMKLLHLFIRLEERDRQLLLLVAEQLKRRA